MIGIDIIGVRDDSYDANAYRDGRRYFFEKPNASGVTREDGTFLVDVPGWHLFAAYDKFFRFGFDDAKAGREPMIIGAAADPDARRVQEALIANGFALPKYGADGRPGAETRDAIAAFWAARGVSHAPVIDDDLRRALGVPVPIASAPSRSATASSSPARTSTTTAPSAPEQSEAPVGDNLFTKKIVGPVRVWHALAGLLAAGGTTLLLSHKKGSTP